MGTTAEHVQPASLLPPKPEEPLESECCGTGCTPCVFDIYKDKLRRWEDDCARLCSNNFSTSNETFNSYETSILTPYEYRAFKVEEIISDCLHCKILRFRKCDNDCLNREEPPSSYFSVSRFPVKVGQHVLLKIEEKCRQYTVLDVRKDGSFTIIFKVYVSGLLTPLVDRLIVGSVVQMRGPFGKVFEYKPNYYKSLLMFAAGTGIAPFCRIIEPILGNEVDETRILLCFSCKTENEIMLLGKLKEWSRSWNFQVEYFLSQAQDPKGAQNKHYGAKFHFKRIDKAVIEELTSSTHMVSDQILYLICGTKSFEKDMVNFLKHVKVDDAKIKTF